MSASARCTDGRDRRRAQRHRRGCGRARRPGWRWRAPAPCPGCAAARPSCPSGGRPRAASASDRSWRRRACRGTRVGRSARSRGPSLAISTSAASASRCARQNSASPGEPVSSPISISQVTLKPSAPAARRHAPRQRREVDAVLALVVGGAAAVPALVARRSASTGRGRRASALRGRARRRHGRTPARWAARRPRRAAPISSGCAPGSGLSMHLGRDADRRQRRRDLVAQVGAQRRRALGVLALGAVRDAARQRAFEGAAVELARGSARASAREAIERRR